MSIHHKSGKFANFHIAVLPAAMSPVQGEGRIEGAKGFLAHAAVADMCAIGRGVEGITYGAALAAAAVDHLAFFGHQRFSPLRAFRAPFYRSLGGRSSEPVGRLWVITLRPDLSRRRSGAEPAIDGDAIWLPSTLSARSSAPALIADVPLRPSRGNGGKSVASEAGSRLFGAPPRNPAKGQRALGTP